MRRKSLAIVLMLVLALFIQAGCSKAPEAKPTTGAETSKQAATEATTAAGTETKKLVFWDFHGGAEKDFFANAVNEYNKLQKGVNIELVIVNQADYTTTKLPTAFANGEGPDIFFVEPGVFMKYAKTGALGDLTSYFDPEVLGDFQPASIDAVKYQDKILAIPFEQELLGLYYNVDMLKAANVEVPKTWDELKAAAKKLNTDKVAGLVLPTDKIPYTNFNFFPFMWQAGADVLSEDGSKSVFNSPQMAKALDFFGSFFQDGTAPTKLQLGPWDIGNIGTGIAAMQVMGTWGINDIETKYKDVNIGLAPLPYPADGKPATVAGGQKMAINAKNANVKEAAEFIMWLFGGKDITYASKWVTEAKFAYPPRKSVVDANKELYTKGLRKVFTEQIYDSAIPELRLPAEVGDILGDTLQSVMFDKVPGEKAVKEASEKIDAALNK